MKWQIHEPTESQWARQGELINKAHEKGIVMVAVWDSTGKKYFKTRRK
jgi:hypothetical protein